MRTLVYIALFAASAFVAGCSTSDDAPEDLLPRDTFVQVLVDVQMIEAIYNQNMIRNDNPRQRIARFYSETFEKHGVTREQFTATYAWYYRHPYEMMDVFDEVVLELSKFQAAMHGETPQ